MGDEAQSALDTPRGPRSPGGSDDPSSCVNRKLGRHHRRAAKPVGISTSILLAGLITYEVAFFEWDDWNEDGSPPGAMGFTGPALLWGLCALWSLSQVIFCGLHVCSSKFRSFNHNQQVKVVKYCVQIAWGTTFALLYLLFQLYVDGFIACECTDGRLARSESTHPGSCMMQWSFPYLPPTDK